MDLLKLYKVRVCLFVFLSYGEREESFLIKNRKAQEDILNKILSGPG